MNLPSRQDVDIAFVVHEAKQTGPPMVILRFLIWLQQCTEISFGVILLTGGPLEEAFRALGPVWVLSDTADQGFWNRLTLRWRFRHLRSSLVVINTAVSIRALRWLRRPKRGVVTMIHELDVGLRYYLPNSDHRLLMARTDRFIAAADCVRDNLVDGHGVSADHVVTVHEFIDVDTDSSFESADVTEAQHLLGVDPDVLIVGACGLTQWRKGPDLFVRVASEVRDQTEREVHFVWVGGVAEGPEVSAWIYDLERMVLRDRFHFVGHQTKPLAWISLFDVFVLPSREDAFPLVCLEAAALGKPIVCFDSGGTSELVGSDERGFVVDYPDTSAMAERIVWLLESSGRRAEIGERARSRVRQCHDVRVAAPRLLAELDPWLA